MRTFTRIGFIALAGSSQSTRRTAPTYRPGLPVRVTFDNFHAFADRIVCT